MREAHLPTPRMMPECKLCNSISSLLLDWHKQPDKDQNKISSVHQARQGLSCCSFLCWPTPLLFLLGWEHYSVETSEMEIYNNWWSVDLQSVTIDNRESTKPRCMAVIFSCSVCTLQKISCLSLIGFNLYCMAVILFYIEIIHMLNLCAPNLVLRLIYFYIVHLSETLHWEMACSIKHGEKNTLHAHL